MPDFISTAATIVIAVLPQLALIALMDRGNRAPSADAPPSRRSEVGR